MIINSVIAGGGSSAPAHYIQRNVDGNGKLVTTGSMNVIDLTGVIALDSFILYRAYYGNTNISGNINLGSISAIGSGSMNSTFYNCSGITGIDWSGAENILTSGEASAEFNQPTYQAFYNCINITSIDLHNVKTITGTYAFFRIFERCSGITNIDLSSLKTLGQFSFSNTFRNCTSLASVNLSNLENLNNQGCMIGCFTNCLALTELRFPALRPQFGNAYIFNLMCTDIPNITIHFPANTQTAVEGLAGYSLTAPFGSSSGTILFDLPSTNILTGADTKNYQRNPKYDTATSLAWRIQDTGTLTNPIIDWTPYYTSGTTDPAVSDTIYSDAACTTPVTTISSIA